jgi:hypothetical protein
MRGNILKERLCVTYDSGTAHKEVLVGKTIDKFALINDCDGESMLIVTFTDNSFIALEIFYDEDRREYVFEDACVLLPDGGAYVRDGKLYYTRIYQTLKDLGVIELDDSSVQEEIEKREFNDEHREFLNYIRLKAKFGKNEDFFFKKFKDC